MVIGGVFDSEKKFEIENDTVILLQTNIDDMNPEYYDLIFKKLYAESALEVYLTPIIMKKSRPANILNVICKPENNTKIQEIIFRETSAIGVRKQIIHRNKLKRENITVKTRYGKINIKISFLGNELLNIKPEYEDCKKISIEKNIPISKVVNSAIEDYKKWQNI